MLSHSTQSCIDSAKAYQKELLDQFNNRSYASLQLVEALAHAEKPTSVVELSQEIPFQRSHTTINKILNDFRSESIVIKKVKEGESVKEIQWARLCKSG